jgi:hypothetical protein
MSFRAREASQGIAIIPVEGMALYHPNCDSFCETAAPVKPEMGLP